MNRRDFIKTAFFGALSGTIFGKSTVCVAETGVAKVPNINTKHPSIKQSQSVENLRQRVREALTGPVCSIPTPFRKSDDAIDKDALAKMIDFQIASGFKMIFLTPGNSHYNILTTGEMYELNKFCVEYTNKRALVCVTEYGSSTRRSVEMARAMKAAGADLMLPRCASWGGSVNQDTLVDFYLACAKEIPLMLIYPAAASTENSISVQERVIAQTDRVLAIKDDVCNHISRRMTLKFADKCAVFAGGQKQHYLNVLPYGATGYLSTFGMFRPDIAWKFNEACNTGNRKMMTAIIRDYDMPYFSLVARQTGGFDAAIHATLELFGFGSRHRRAPYANMSDAEMEVFKDALMKLNIIK